MLFLYQFITIHGGKNIFVTLQDVQIQRLKIPFEIKIYSVCF